MIARLARRFVSGALGTITAVVIWNIAIHRKQHTPAGHGRGWRADGRNGWAVL